ncbi:MAG: MFS transporter [Promethearchaeota archaeon]
MKLIANKFAIYFSYLVQGIYYTFFGMFLPVYLINYLGLEEDIVALVPFVSFIPVISKPLLSILSDRFPIKGFHRKYYATIGSFIFIFSVFTSSFTSPILSFLIFTFLQFGAYLGMALIDVSLDGLMVDQLQTQQDRMNTISIFTIFSTLGGFITTMFYSKLKEISDLVKFNSLFIVAAVVALPLLILTLIIYEEPAQNAINKNIQQNKNNSLKNNKSHNPNDNLNDKLNKNKTEIKQDKKQGNEQENQNKRSKLSDSEHNAQKIKIIPFRVIIAIVIFVLFLNADKLSDWILEPFLVEKFGQETFDSVYSSWVSIFYFLTIIGYLFNIILGKKNSNRGIIASKNILTISLIIFAIYWFLFPILDITGLLILVAIINFLSGVALVQFINIFVVIAQTISKRSKATIYQLINALYAIGSWIPVPLGLLLTNVLPKTVILAICGIPMLICALTLNIFINFFAENNHPS